MDIIGQIGVSDLGTVESVADCDSLLCSMVEVGPPSRPDLSQQTPLYQKCDYSNSFASPTAK